MRTAADAEVDYHERRRWQNYRQLLKGRRFQDPMRTALKWVLVLGRTQYEAAKAAGVSRQAVSKALKSLIPPYICANCRADLCDEHGRGCCSLACDCKHTRRKHARD